MSERRRERRRFRPLWALLSLAIVACQSTPVAPPTLDLPTSDATAPALAHWWQQFDDPTLNALIDEALASNLDLRSAMVRVDLARANVLLAQSSLFPSLNLTVDPSRGRSTLAGWQPLPAGFNPVHNDYLVALRASYEVDLWGRYANGTAAARQDLLSTAYARETVRVAIVAETARAYFGLLAADAERALQRETLQAREQTLALQNRLQQAGVIGDFDLQRAQAERAAVLANLAAAERTVGQYETALAAIVGRSPREVYQARIARDASPARLLTAPEIPADLPSDLLERRPDVKQAE
ncbi:MAG TPA: TolC family protein, partial [Accumulibacter sp.]|nr:TolC family protein [Accumulibacter sp.]